MRDTVRSNTDAAVEFLEQLRPGGPWVLSAFDPDDARNGRTLTCLNVKAIAAFVRRHDGERNLYFSTNPTREPVTKKAAKTDIAAIEYVFGDLDPADDETPAAAKQRYLQAIAAHKAQPAFVIDSGNGLQVLFKLDAPIELQAPEGKGKEKKFPDATQEIIDDVEARAKALMEELGSVAGTQNCDRILRLPGTTNLPNKTKRAKGRVPCPALLLQHSDSVCRLEDFPAPPRQQQEKQKSQAPAPLDWDKVAKQHEGWLKSADDLPENFSKKGRAIIAHEGSFKDLNADLLEAGLIDKPYKSGWSSVSLALAAILKADGRYSHEQIAAALMADLPCNQHITKLKDRAQQRAIERLLSRSHEPTRVMHALPWRECDYEDQPLPSLHNARLAITALGIACSYDTFHNKMLFGFRDNEVQLALQPMLGEISDNGVMRLRQIISDKFGLDMGATYTRDAVVSLALEHCFDPVCDMLMEAQGQWDGVERLDRMAVDYFNCADTPYNRAVLRKTMIAAVRRARQPGCKHDAIPTLEAPEGWNKSGAWRVLAGDENFSDASILGKHGREVQEHLAEIWIHENADLAGMRKAEIEDVKTFACRQSDDARPAYGHFLKKQPRHSIEVGTTNANEYLQSQTGNRRFQPVIVHKSIDLDKLKRDRMQLWGEAATYEAAGESNVLDPALWPAAADEQEMRRVKDPWEAILSNMPMHVLEGTRGNRNVLYHKGAPMPEGVELVQIIHRLGKEEQVASADVLQFVLGIPPAQQQRAYAMRLAEVMKAAGWQRPDCGRVSINNQQVRGYFREVVEQPAVEQSETPPPPKVSTRGSAAPPDRPVEHRKTRREKLTRWAPA